MNQSAKLARLFTKLIVRERDRREYGNLHTSVALIEVVERPNYVRVVMEAGTITQALNKGPGRVPLRAGLAVKLMRRADGELVVDGQDDRLMEGDVGVPSPPSGVPAHSFVEHIDVPSTYTGAAGDFVRVADTEDGLVFSAAGTEVGDAIDSAAEQTTLEDANRFALVDTGVLKFALWSTIKSAIATYYNSLTATLTNKTLTAPVIADFANAQHDHGDADDGGNIPYSSITGTPSIPVSVGTFLEYTTTTTVTLPPPSGKWATNNINFASTVELGVSYFDADSNDISEKWATFSGIINDTIGMMWIQKEDDATVWAAFRLTGIQFFPADDYALFNAAFIGGSGTSMPNNTPCRIIFSISGDAGWSAYEVAVDQGFVGDEAAWLASLVGPQGDPGDAADIAAEISGASTDDTIGDADLWGYVTGGVLVKTAWSNIKAVLKTYFDTLYNLYVHPNHTGDVTSVADGATTIGANKVLTAMIADAQVTLAKQADLAADTIIGRANAAGTGVPQALTAAQLITIIEAQAIYALLAGRAGGQTLSGGNAANDDLTIQGTAHSTRTTSYVKVQPSGGLVSFGNGTPTELVHIFEGVMRIARDSTSGPGYFEFEETQVGGKIGKFDIFGGIMRFGERFVSNILGVDLVNKRVGVATMAPAGKLHVDQDSTTAAIATLVLDQGDVSEPMIEFETTVGAGNTIQAVAALAFTPTHYLKIRLPDNSIGYIRIGTIA